jgi:hypothetical protein
MPAGTVLFQENFDSLSVGAATATPGWTPTGPVEIAAQGAAGSKQTLHLTPMGGMKSGIDLKMFSAPNNSFWGRMFVKVKQFATAPNYAHFILVEASSSSGGEQLRPIGGQYIMGNGSLWGVGSDQGATGDWTSWQTSTPTVDNKWQCIEWQVLSSNSEVDVWIDGKAQTDLTVTKAKHGGNGTLTFPTFNEIFVGWWVFQSGTTPSTFDVNIDEIVLATERVGCP